MSPLPHYHLCTLCCMPIRTPTSCPPPSTPLPSSLLHGSCAQELPCDHPIVTSYSADLQARFELATRATKPQGTPLLTHKTPLNPKNPGLAKAPGLSATTAVVSAAVAVGRDLEQETEIGPDSSSNSSGGSSSDGGSSASSSTSSSGGELVFRSSSWVVGVDRHTGKAISLLGMAVGGGEEGFVRHQQQRQQRQPRWQGGQQHI
jgi:hypothetical protein